MIIETQFLVLSKQPYRENSLLLRGISPDAGAVSLVYPHGQKNNGKTEPVADLYRELNVEYNAEGEGGSLFTLIEAECVKDFGSLALRPRNYIMAGRISEFILRNSKPDLPQTYVYDAMLTVLGHLAGGPIGASRIWTLEECAVVIKLVFLYDCGVLPPAQNEKQENFIEEIVAAGVENMDLPKFDAEYCHKLNLWLNDLLIYNKLR